jgi:hypothetical protein
MNKVGHWGRNLLAVVGLLAIGYWLGNMRTVKAASHDSDSEIEFQLAGVTEGSSLLVYQPSSRTVYVYRGATQGSSTVQCSFKFVLGSPGGAIQRLNCPIGSALP